MEFAEQAPSWVAPCNKCAPFTPGSHLVQPFVPSPTGRSLIIPGKSSPKHGLTPFPGVSTIV
eukprot:355330-Chlamydomonas_euryale.AAC.6